MWMRPSSSLKCKFSKIFMDIIIQCCNFEFQEMKE